MNIATYLRPIRDGPLLGMAILAGPLSRQSVRPLRDERRRTLPGDAVLPTARVQWTYAITIRARPSDIWPWLIQMGCRRAGWYSYDGIDNGSVPSARRIVPAWQRAQVGDLFAWTPTASDGFFVRAVEPERMLVLGGNVGPFYQLAWAFVLEPLDATRTRLLTRSRAGYTRSAAGLVLRVAVRPLSFAMQRKQLLNLKRRAGATAIRREQGSQQARSA